MVTLILIQTSNGGNMSSPWSAGKDVLPLLRKYRDGDEYKMSGCDVLMLIIIAVLVLVDPLWFFGF